MKTESLALKILLTLLLIAVVSLAFYYLWDAGGLHISFPELAAVAEDSFPEATDSAENPDSGYFLA